MDSNLAWPAQPVLAVVDDEPLVRQFLSLALQPLGAEVVQCGTLAEFNSGLARRDFDCAVVDLQLPDGTGLDAAAFVRAAHRSTTLVLVSGFVNVKIAVQALQGGMIDVLEKPFAPAELLTSVRGGITLCQERRSRDALARDAQARLESLTDSERQVLDLVIEGLPNKLIARRLELGLRTIESRKAQLYRKLDARSVSDLVRLTLGAAMAARQTA